MFATAVVGAAGAAPPATNQEVAAPLRYGVPMQLAVLEHEAIRESSGLAASRLRPGVFWTHNDSGDKPRLYAFDTAGTHLGCWEAPGAERKIGKTWRRSR